MSGEGLRATIGVSLWGGQIRGAQPNARTMVARAAALPGVGRSARELFVQAYARFAERARAIEEPGVAVVAIDEASGAAAGLACVVARVGRPVAAIIGRHDRCDLFLSGRDALSLRHLALVVDPVTSWARGAPVRFRLLDLRTGQPMVDETGKPLRGLVAEGPAIVRCAGYALFFLPLGDPSDFPASADDAWTMLPERVYLDERPSLDERPAPSEGAQATHAKLRPRVDLRATYITRTGGPRDTSMHLAHGDVAGVLEIHTPLRQLAISIGDRALRDGVLLGRYGRCDLMEAAAEDHTLSRVHALLIHVEDRLLLIDTASTNGTFVQGEPARLVVIERDTELGLGDHTTLRWRWKD